MSVLFRVTFAIVYTVGFAMVVLFSVGAGEGTTIFMSAFLSWQLILVCVGLLSWLHVKDTRTLFIGLMLLHYILSIALAVATDSSGLSDTRRYIQRYPSEFIAYFLWYALGQFFIWAAFRRQSRSSLA